MLLVHHDMRSRLAEVAAAALGAERARALADLSGRVAGLDALTADAGTIDVLLMPLTSRASRDLQEQARRTAEAWVFAGAADGTPVLAVDEPSEAGMRDPAAAVTYPELHMRLVSWWLAHAWRSIDLLEDTIENLQRWRVTSGAVTARAVIEEAGSLAEEARKLAAGWTAAKAAPADPLNRPRAVREALAPVLLHAALGSRMKTSHEKLQATNVLTLVQKLAKATADDRFTDWYDWLSDAAHPAFGARIAFASPPMAHPSRAVAIRSYARSPMSLEGNGERRLLEPTIAFAIADATIAAGKVINDVLQQALNIVDDVGLTTEAATLTLRAYWRNFTPVRGKRPCPCGRGPSSACGHRWGEPAREIAIPGTQDTATQR
jgi:hypothetical protein